MTTEVHCQRCDEIIPPGERYKVRYGERSESVLTRWCGDCINSYAVKCAECNTRYPVEERETHLIYVSERGMRESVYCYHEDCYVEHLWFCLRDGAPNFNRNRYCKECKMDTEGNIQRCQCGGGTESSPIHQYNCEPNLVFHGESDTGLFMGFELEAQIPNSQILDAALFAMNALQTDEIAQLKSDGSIGGGFEIVTQPHTYEAYLSNTKLWETIEVLRTDYRARSWDSGTCGLHIHISRAAFRDGQHTHRFIEFIYRNSEMMMKFGGRKSEYARFNDVWGFDEYDKPIFTLEGKSRGDDLHGGEKYTAVNTLKRDTLELRFIRGTMNIAGVKASLGLAHALVGYTIQLNSAMSNWYAWNGFVEWVNDRPETYPELIARLPEVPNLVLAELARKTIDA